MFSHKNMLGKRMNVSNNLKTYKHYMASVNIDDYLYDSLSSLVSISNFRNKIMSSQQAREKKFKIGNFFALNTIRNTISMSLDINTLNWEKVLMKTIMEKSFHGTFVFHSIYANFNVKTIWDIKNVDITIDYQILK